MLFSTPQIFQFILHYKYIVLFPIAEIEGPVITIIAGFLASLGYLNIFVALAVMILGDVTGDSVHYAIGRWGREKFVSRWGKYIGITRARVEGLDRHFENHRFKTFAIGKIAHGVGGAVLVAAGMARVPFREFLFDNLLITIVKSSILITVGYYFGQAYVRIGSYLEFMGIATLGLVVILGTIYFFYRPRKNIKL
ncbi:MAG: DedA family protein [Parcubacteria group bacterium]|jgi:membrane protein DedA with SNARE-associated domain